MPDLRPPQASFSYLNLDITLTVGGALDQAAMSQMYLHKPPLSIMRTRPPSIPSDQTTTNLVSHPSFHSMGDLVLHNFEQLFRAMRDSWINPAPNIGHTTILQQSMSKSVRQC